MLGVEKFLMANNVGVDAKTNKVVCKLSHSIVGEGGDSPNTKNLFLKKICDKGVVGVEKVVF